MIKIYDMETLEEREILFRGGSGADVSAPVAEILRAVQERGDAALREYTLRFDGAAPDALAVTAEEVDQAAAQVEPAFLAVLEEAAEHIRAYHARQKRESFVMTEREGVVLDVSGEIPKSFVVCDHPYHRQIVYLSQLNSTTLQKRAESGNLE